MLLIVLAALSFDSVIDYFQNENFDNTLITYNTPYVDQLNNTNVLTLDTQSQTLAGSVFSDDSSVNVDEFVRIQFYSYNLTNWDGEDSATTIKNKTWYSAKKCSDLYANQSNSMLEKEYGSQVSGATWVCPDIPEIILNNSPYLFNYGTGMQFSMVVNDC